MTANNNINNTVDERLNKARTAPSSIKRNILRGDFIYKTENIPTQRPNW